MLKTIYRSNSNSRRSDTAVEVAKLRAAGGVLIALMLAGCAGGGLSFGGSAPDAQSVPAGMAGRWILAAPDAPACGMNFRGDAHEGTVSPEGGCPGKFFLSRRWSLEQDTLVINDEDSRPLGQLKLAGGRYEGQSATGTPVTLARPPAPAN
jgi:hypothetical protein